MDRLDGFLVAALAALLIGIARQGWMPRRAACCYGRPMMQTQPLARAELAPSPRAITLLGATGSIGSSTIDLLRQDAGRYRVEAVTAHRNAAALARLARELGARFAAVADPAAYGELKDELSGSGIEAAPATTPSSRRRNGRPTGSWRRSPVRQASSRRWPRPSAARRLRSPTRNASSAPAPCSCGGRRRPAPTVLPVDSEHNAIFQALGAGRREDVRRIILTASGGPFRTWPLEAMRKVTLEQALKHPTWSMGPKITINSATLMNKGLELIEAHHLFALGAGGARRRRASAIGRPWAGRVP